MYQNITSLKKISRFSHKINTDFHIYDFHKKLIHVFVSSSIKTYTNTLMSGVKIGATKQKRSITKHIL